MEPWTPPLLLSCPFCGSLFCGSWFISHASKRIPIRLLRRSSKAVRLLCSEGSGRWICRNRGQGGTTREHFTPMTDLQQAPVICRTQPVSVIELYCLEDPVLQVSFSLRTDFVKLCTSMISWSISRGRSWLSSVNIFLWRAAAPGTRERPSPNVNDEQLARAMQERPTSENNQPPQHVPEAVPRHACIWLAFEL